MEATASTNIIKSDIHTGTNSLLESPTNRASMSLCTYFINFNEISFNLSTVFGIPTNILLIVLVLMTNQKVLKNYRAMLLLYSGHDLLVAIVFAFSRLSSNLIDGKMVLGMNPMIQNTSLKLLTIILYAYSMTMNVGMVFINCHYRYTTVKSRLNSKSFHWIWSYTLINLIVITIAIGCALAFNNGKSIQADEIEGICFPKSFNNFLYTENKNLYNKVLFTAILAAFILAYVGSSVFNRKTLNLLKNNLRFQNERTLSMQSQLSKVIIVQSLVQLAASVGPVTLICVCILTNTEATIDMLIFGCISWLPLFNSAATIIIIKPYRRRLMAMWRQKTLCVSMTHVSHLHYMSSNWQSKTFTSR